MSDYFTRLAERALGVIETVKPRVPSRFERGAYALSLMPSVEQDDEKSAMLEEVDPPPRMPAQDPPLPRPKDQDRTRSGPPRAEESPRDIIRSDLAPPAPKVPKAFLAPKVPKAPGESRRASTPPVTVAAAQSESVAGAKRHVPIDPPRPANAVVSPTRDAPAKEAARLNRRTEIHPFHARTESHPVKTSIFNETSVQVTARPVPGPPAPMKPRVPSKPAVESDPHPSFDEATRVLRPRKRDEHDPAPGSPVWDRERRAEPSGEPTIKVTIGRVEVRAVMEPPKAPVQQRKAASRAIALDEYLKRHAERRR